MGDKRDFNRTYPPARPYSKQETARMNSSRHRSPTPGGSTIVPLLSHLSARPLTTKGKVRVLPPLRLHRSDTMPDLRHVSDLRSPRSSSQWKSPYTPLSPIPAVPSYPPGSIESPASNKIRVRKHFGPLPNPQSSDIEQPNMGVSDSRSPSPIPSPIMPRELTYVDMQQSPELPGSFQSKNSGRQSIKPISTRSFTFGDRHSTSTVTLTVVALLLRVDRYRQSCRYRLICQKPIQCQHMLKEVHDH